MVEIKWCKEQKRGFKLIEPNENLSKEYMQTAEETLDILREIQNKSKVWTATTKYYCEYFSIYSLFMKIGLKCEIHDCTIAICKILGDMNVLPKEYFKILKKDKQLRIDNQYYLKNRDVVLKYDELLDFVLNIKDINEKITNKKIDEIRNYLLKNDI